MPQIVPQPKLRADERANLSLWIAGGLLAYVALGFLCAQWTHGKYLPVAMFAAGPLLMALLAVAAFAAFQLAVFFVELRSGYTKD
ncbi:hypothetical protein [Bradyrhizobium sp. LHD-71]|uniref:hypothetical protein n=1 Tax=Bradyrhizobium sp. LHD-71 TaxID=3072141 RepID=UPI00280FC9FF|nr:hypothetical protein [Bradyrhizobium sp. LHD-71]MDQ8729371.1 hypothetical protein [Bradyrhizobium sp. LHD-71]